MDNAVAQQVGNADEPRLETVPLRDPRGQIGERPPHQIRQISYLISTASTGTVK